MDLQIESTLNALDTKKCVVCLEPCEKICSNCKKVNYCSVQHQKDHRKRHRPDCFPALELRNEELGRFLITTRDLTPGEKIFEESPLISGPTTFDKVREGYGLSIRPLCLGCCKVLPGSLGDNKRTCERCFWPLCGPDCPKKSVHDQNECSVFTNADLKPEGVKKIHFTFDMVTILRMLLLKRKDPMKWAKIMDLESKAELRMDNFDEAKDSAMTIIFVLSLCHLSMEEFLPKVVQKLFYIMKTNCQGLQLYDEYSMYDIYEKSSKLIHSCVSNTFAIASTLSDKNKLQSKIEIPRGSILTEFYGAYSLNYMGINERRKFLHVAHHFWCKCARCIDPTELGTYSSAIKCYKVLSIAKRPEPCRGYYLPIINPRSPNPEYGQWQCDQCKSQKGYDILSKIYDRVEREIFKAKTLEEQIEVVTSQASKTVHANHCLLMRVRLDMLSELRTQFKTTDKTNQVFRRELADTMKDAVTKLLINADKFFAGRSPERGVLLCQLTKAIEMGGEFIPATEMVKNMFEISKIIKEAKEILVDVPRDSSAYAVMQDLNQRDQILDELCSSFSKM